MASSVWQGVLAQSLKDLETLGSGSGREASLDKARRFYELADEAVSQEEVVERVGREDFDTGAVAALGNLTGRFRMVLTSAGRGDSLKK